jgi:hypothetical protein
VVLALPRPTTSFKDKAVAAAVVVVAAHAVAAPSSCIAFRRMLRAAPASLPARRLFNASIE